MKAKIGKKQRYLTLSPKPNVNVSQGLRLYMTKDYTNNLGISDTCEPVATTSILAGKKRYTLLPEMRDCIIKIEVLNNAVWEPVDKPHDKK